MENIGHWHMSLMSKAITQTERSQWSSKIPTTQDSESGKIPIEASTELLPLSFEMPLKDNIQ